MIGISKLTQDVDGAVIFQEKVTQKPPTFTARVNRTATLDGGVVIDHQGYTPGDTILEITAEVSEAQETILESIFQEETFIHISTKYGFFKGVISALSASNGKIKLTLEIQEEA